MTRQVLTIMLTDIQGFTEKTSNASRDDLVKLLKAHEGLLMPVVQQFKGLLIKTIGDALLVTFESPTDAVLCGLMMQQQLFEYNQGKEPGDWIQIRIAINTGEVELIEGDIYGEAVNITARIEGITEANEIYFTEAVYLAMNKSEVPTSEVGSRVLKGIPEEVKVFRVIQDRDSEDFKALLHKLNSMAEAGQDILADKERTGVASRAGVQRRFMAFPAAIVAVSLLLGGLYIFSIYPAQHAYNQVDKALSEGDLALARSRANEFIKSHPTEKDAVRAIKSVINAEAKRLFDRGYYQEAIELVDKDAEKYNLDANDLTRPFYLNWGEQTMGKVHWNRSKAIYSSILNRYSKDSAAMKGVIRVLLQVKKGWEERLLITAAINYSELVKPPFEQGHLSALMLSFNEFPDYQLANEVRSIFISNPKLGEALIHKELRSPEWNHRTNAYLILKERNQLSDDEMLRYHAINFLSSKQRKFQSESLTWIYQQSQLPNWELRKKRVGELDFSSSNVLKRANNDHIKAAHKTLIAAFLPEVEKLLVARANGHILDQTGSEINEACRIGAYEILEKAGKLDQVDIFSFHKKTLTSYEIKYRMNYFVSALKYLENQKGKGRDKEIRKALKNGIIYTKSWIDRRKSLGWSKEALKIERSNMKSMELLLAKFK